MTLRNSFSSSRRAAVQAFLRSRSSADMPVTLVRGVRDAVGEPGTDAGNHDRGVRGEEPGQQRLHARDRVGEPGAVEAGEPRIAQVGFVDGGAGDLVLDRVGVERERADGGSDRRMVADELLERGRQRPDRRGRARVRDRREHGQHVPEGVILDAREGAGDRRPRRLERCAGLDERRCEAGVRRARQRVAPLR